VALGDNFVQADLDTGHVRFNPAQWGTGASGYSQTGYGNLHQHYADIGYVVTDGIANSGPAKLNIDIAPVATPRASPSAPAASPASFSTATGRAPRPTKVSAKSSFLRQCLLAGRSRRVCDRLR